MANINIENISDLNLNGNDLFDDSESFIAELSDDSEQSNIKAVVGGSSPACLTIVTVVAITTESWLTDKSL